MRSTRDLVGFAALAAAVPAVIGQATITSTSLQSNLSTTRVTLVPTGSAFCCEMLADGVGLNFWWSSTRGPYVATVVTSYIQYDNTVLTELATITGNSTAIGTVPNDIIPTHNVYRGTTLARSSTIASYPTTIIASPTPHLVVDQFIYFTGSKTAGTGGTSSCEITLSTVARFLLRTPYVYVEDPPVTRTDGAFLPGPPTDIIDQILTQNPTVSVKYPYLTDCSIPSGTGQPTVHIPVTALTSASSTTIRRQGDAPASTTTSRGQTTHEQEPPASTTEPAPGPSTAPVEPSSTSVQPETPPTMTQPPSDKPTGPASPPSSTVVDPPSPPENTQAPPENTQAPPENTQAPPENTQAPPENTQAPPENTQAPPESNQVPPENTPAPPASTLVPPNPVPTNPQTSDVVNPPVSGNTQPPVESSGSAPQPSDAVPPSAGPIAPSNSPSLPFPIVPVPVPTAPAAPTAAPTVGNDDTTPIVDSPTSTPIPGGVVLPGDQTLNPGQQTTISGVVISVPSPVAPDSDATAPVVIVDGTTSTLSAAPSGAPPLVVVDGTTVTLPAAAPTEVEQPVVPVTIGTQVVSLEAPSASGEGIVLPNSETLELGSTTVVDEQTLVATVVTSGTSVATVVEVADESTTVVVTLPTAVPTESDGGSEETGGVTGTSSGLPEFTGAAVSRVGTMWGWGLIGAAGLVVLGLA